MQSLGVAGGLVCFLLLLRWFAPLQYGLPGDTWKVLGVRLRFRMPCRLLARSRARNTAHAHTIFRNPVCAYRLLTCNVRVETRSPHDCSLCRLGLGVPREVSGHVAREFMRLWFCEIFFLNCSVTLYRVYFRGFEQETIMLPSYFTHWFLRCKFRLPEEVQQAHE